mmetsp:Transcript_33410/g.96523  ORF Transcript_33410/g.96523 Transcript_33410/m.96523 type:complete len:201 (+) Transcript_33410:495-1097(+)
MGRAVGGGHADRQTADWTHKEAAHRVDQLHQTQTCSSGRGWERLDLHGRERHPGGRLGAKHHRVAYRHPPPLVCGEQDGDTREHRRPQAQLQGAARPDPLHQLDRHHDHRPVGHVHHQPPQADPTALPLSAVQVVIHPELVQHTSLSTHAPAKVVVVVRLYLLLHKPDGNLPGGRDSRQAAGEYVVGQQGPVEERPRQCG